MRVSILCALLAACGSSSGAPDGSPIDSSSVDVIHTDAAPGDAAIDAAPGASIELSKWPRGSETFTAFGNGATLPFVHGFQGFNYVELKIRVPATVTAPMPEFDLHYDVIGLGATDQMNIITLGTADGGVRESDRYLIFINQFTMEQLEGTSCHITAQFPQSPQLGTWDGTVTLHFTGCLDNGADVVCPDGGVP